MKIITKAEAFALIDDDALELPVRTINDAGKREVAAFVARHATNPAQHNLDAWFAAAEQEAGNTALGGSIILEMPGRMTSSRHPETLNLDAACFDWSINV